MPDPSLHVTDLPAPPWKRRHLLLGAAAVAVSRAAWSTPLGTATLLIAGPNQGATAIWADLLLPALRQALPAGIQLDQECVGGVDGVTAANQFEARNAPDGETALLLPGATAMAWLTGDPRARFNAAQWLTVMSGTTPVVLASRVPLQSMGAGQVVRVAGNPAGSALPALLVFELLGCLPQAVPSRPDYVDTDVIVLSGRDIERQVQAGSRAGLMPVLALRSRNPNGQVTRDTAFSELPTSGDLIFPVARRPLATALDAVIAAARLDTAMVLPPLTSATMVALWRHACTQAAAAPETQSGAARLGVHAETEAAAVASMAPLAMADASALLDLREWLAQRFGWHPS